MVKGRIVKYNTFFSDSITLRLGSLFVRFKTGKFLFSIRYDLSTLLAFPSILKRFFFRVKFPFGVGDGSTYDPSLLLHI